MRIPINCILSLLILVSASACAGVGEITVEDAWSRPAFFGDNGVIYLRINNTGDMDDNLIGASTDIAGAAEIHLSKMDENGVISMEPQNLIVLPAGSHLDFSPGGLHIMLINLTKDISIGDSFPLTLEFQRAGDITVQVEVRQP